MVKVSKTSRKVKSTKIAPELTKKQDAGKEEKVVAGPESNKANDCAASTLDVPKRVGLLERIKRRRAERERNGESADSQSPRRGLLESRRITRVVGIQYPDVNSQADGQHAAEENQVYLPNTDVDSGTSASSNKPPQSNSASTVFDGLDIATTASDRAASKKKRPKKAQRLPDTETQQFITLPPIVGRLAGGGNNSLVLARMVYWLSPGKDGRPRARPQPDLQNPTWEPGYLNIAKEIGLDISNRSRAEKQVSRAVSSLQRRHLLDVESNENHFLEEELVTFDQRQQSRKRLRFTNECEKQLNKAGLLVPSNKKLAVVKVWRSDVRAYGANTAILLGQLWYHCVINEKKLWVTKYYDKYLPKSMKYLSAETGLTKDQVRSAIEKLRGKKLIIADRFLFMGSKTLHFRISDAARQFITKMRSQPESHDE